MSYRDSHNKALTDYPRPSVAVDTAVLTVPTDGELSVVLARTRADDGWRLPGSFLHEGELLADAARRALATKAGITGIRPHQLHVFDAPNRDDRGWVLSLAHYAAVAIERVTLDPATARIVPVAEVGELQYDHSGVIDRAVQRLRENYRLQPDPFGMLTQPFTLRELHQLHERVAGANLMRDTFRRLMEPQLHDTGELSRGGRGKPARVFSVAR